MMLGLILLYVGAVLFLNGIWLTNRIAGREVAVINVLVGVLSLLVALHLIFGADANAATVKAGACTLMFAFTYLWVAANQFLGTDGRGLGWFCLFVSLTAAGITVQSFIDSEGAFGLWNALNWGAWTVLWFSFFLLLGLARKIQKQVAWLTLGCAVFTGWVPGALILGQMISV
ncbi:AmiS/UreI family transporter [Pseudomonas rubra]|uniref:AmiS/UreI family transporter n=1 Tax=Pseudomonas rubra TaxID=2942627 RepID=A0ABT5PCI0_9PSED|nr:AmiS/UreI family transporter [Pseudomonas rubra]MDD1015891.1 AmiS/UreI family transporter [Pseudomonas rubra]MDD1040205.1 AmiS/UreI family transporter [Pseudomonas rubra]MDD1157919.1 AmiS/UreI family transporter [Pseudomonas rubra]